MARTRSKVKQEPNIATQEDMPRQSELPHRHTSIAADNDLTQSTDGTMMNEDMDMRNGSVIDSAGASTYTPNGHHTTNGAHIVNGGDKVNSANLTDSNHSMNGSRATNGNDIPSASRSHAANGYGIGHRETEENDAMHALGQRSRKLIKAIQKLEALGIDSTLPSLPKFVVVGDQSHGKSSMIEALCDISLPRNEGTCTRCPFRITTTASASDTSWSCKISLIRSHRYDPQLSLDETDYAHWDSTSGDPNPVLFHTVIVKEDLEHALRLAQVAILCPDISPQRILESNNTDITTTASFSPNVIALDISGPELPELCLIDLPGAITVSKKRDEDYLPEFVQRLLTGYLNDDKALILLAVAASADTDTSTAFSYVRKTVASDRCVGVLTKPDLMTRSDHQVSSLLSGDDFPLGHGWFVVKQRSQAELNAEISHKEAREREIKFFSNRKPWSTSLAPFSKRFGTANLQDALSQKLTGFILSELPEINSRVENRLHKVEHKLASFPERSQHPYVTVVAEINSLTAVIVRHMQGEPGKANEFRDAYKEVLRNLRQKLKSARPSLIMKTPGYTPPAISIDSEDEESSEVATPTKKMKRNDGRASGVPNRPSTEPSRTPRVKTEGTPSSSRNTLLVLKLDELRRKYELGSTSGIPGEMNPQVTEHVIQESMQGWNGLVDQALGKVHALFEKMLTKSISKSLEGRQTTQLFGATKQIVGSLFLGVMQQQREAVHYLVTCEMHKPITYNQEALVEGREAQRKSLLSARLETRLNEYFDTEEAKGAKPTKPEDRRKKMTDHDQWISTHLGSDRYAGVIRPVGTVLAYYDIASDRLPDAIAGRLEHGLFYALESKLTGKLMVDLNVQDPKQCERLLAENQQREQERDGFLEEKQKLTAALAELHGLHVVA